MNIFYGIKHIQNDQKQVRKLTSTSLVKCNYTQVSLKNKYTEKMHYHKYILDNLYNIASTAKSSSFITSKKYN